jgi:trehalose 6-phosphate synthase
VWVPDTPPADDGSRGQRQSSRRNSVGRSVRAAAFPISIDTRGFGEIALRPEVQARAQEIREVLGKPETVLLGVDRLDYTKGILHRLKAYGEVLNEGHLEPPGAVLVQVASPSRERVEHYKRLRDEVEGTVGRINGDFAEVGSPPVHYLHQSYPREEMAALYLAADVMLVTPLRDGMNLVAKEYVAAQNPFDPGVLVLSAFAGAAKQLDAALLVNPHDIDGMARQIAAALAMPLEERRERWHSMVGKLRTSSVQGWFADFLLALGDARRKPSWPKAQPIVLDLASRARAQWR